MEGSKLSNDVTRVTLAVFFIGVLITACFWTLKPFASALIWAAMIVIATWPMLLSIQGKLFNRRWIATLLMTLFLLLILIAPLTYGIAALVGKAQEVSDSGLTISQLKIPPPPDFIHGLPFAGSKIAAKWHEYASFDQAQLTEELLPYSEKIISWFLSQAGSVGMMFIHCFLTVIISAILYMNGEAAADGVRRFVRRVAGQSGDEAAMLAAKAVRGVAVGIVGTALVQSLLGGVGLLISGIPGVIILTAVLFLLCISQLGPAILLVPVTIWLFIQGETGIGIFMIVWTSFVATIDNFIRPVLIRRGADLPLLLILAGVIGGLISFGLIGLFIGPVILAISYTLLKEWTVDHEGNSAGSDSISGGNE